MPPIRISIWKKAPSLRILLSWITGVLVARYLRVSLSVSFLSFVFFLATSICISFLSPFNRWKLRWVVNLLVVFQIIAISICVFQWQDIRNDKNWIGHKHIEDSVWLQIKLESEWQTKSTRSINKAQAISIYQDKAWKEINGNIQLIWPANQGKPTGAWGDVILICATLEELKPPANPGGFDFAGYAALSGLYHQTKVNEHCFKKLKYDSPSIWQRWISSWRNDLLAILRKYLTPKDGVLGIAEALFIGYKADLDPAWIASYQQTGIVHIIAISGLHLGLIYLVLGWLLDRLPVIQHKPAMKSSIIFLLLWIFTLITGASASVLRSAVMFSCLLFGKALGKQGNSANTLAASACLLLMFNPMLVWDLGFQLSYAAIIGIGWLQPLFVFKTIMRWRFGKWLSEAIAITLAAQTMTLPITLALFHQFPTYFLISNLVAVPWSTALLFGEIGLILLAPFSILANRLAALLEMNIRWLNEYVRMIEHWPLSNVTDIPSDAWSTVFLFICIIGFASWKLYGSNRYGYLGLFGIIGLMGWYSIKVNHANRQQKLIVYKTPGASLVEIISGRKSLIFADTNQRNFNRAHMFRTLKESHMYHWVNGETWNYIQDSNNKLLNTGGLSILRISDEFNRGGIDSMRSIDVLLVTHSPKGSIREFVLKSNPHWVVVDASNKSWKMVTWKKELEGLPLRQHFVNEKGAFQLDF
jgi:competence protein ComEC